MWIQPHVEQLYFPDYTKLSLWNFLCYMHDHQRNWYINCMNTKILEHAYYYEYFWKFYPRILYILQLKYRIQFVSFLLYFFPFCITGKLQNNTKQFAKAKHHIKISPMSHRQMTNPAHRYVDLKYVHLVFLCLMSTLHLLKRKTSKRLSFVSIDDFVYGFMLSSLKAI